MSVSKEHVLFKVDDEVIAVVVVVVEVVVLIAAWLTPEYPTKKNLILIYLLSLNIKIYPKIYVQSKLLLKIPLVVLTNKQEWLEYKSKFGNWDWIDM